MAGKSDSLPPDPDAARDDAAGTLREQARLKFLRLADGILGLPAPARSKALKDLLADIFANPFAGLDSLPESLLIEDDSAARSRVIYTMAMIKLEEFLRTPGVSIDGKERQAKLALQYIKHAESAGLAGLQFGRTPETDAKLMGEVEELRRKLNSAAATRIALARKKDATGARKAEAHQPLPEA